MQADFIDRLGKCPYNNIYIGYSDHN